MFHEVSILKTKRCSTQETLTKKMFCGVCMYLICNYTVHYLVQLALQHINSKTHELCSYKRVNLCSFAHIMKPGKTFGQVLSVQ